MRKLIIGDSLERVDVKNDFLLGVWSLLGSDFDDLEESDIDIGDILFSDNDYVEVEKDVKELYLSVLPHIARELNTINRTSHSYEFWRVMLSPWFIDLAEVVCERSARLKQKVRSTKEQLHVRLIDLEGVEFETTFDFLHNGLKSLQFHQWIISKLIEKNNHENILVSQRVLEKFKKDQCKIKPQTTRLKFFIKNLLGVVSVYGFSAVESFLLSLKISKQVAKVKYSLPECEELTCDKKWFYELAMETLPLCFKRISSLKKFTLPIPYRYKLVSGSLLYYEDEYKYVLAKQYEKGMNIVPVQHGSNYGALRNYSKTSLVEYSFGEFITWGWTSHGRYSCNFQRLPSPLISKPPERAPEMKVNDEVVFVGTAMSPFSAPLFSVIHGNKILKYRNHKISFLNTLKEDVFHKTLYRPYPKSKASFSDESFVCSKIRVIKILKGDLSLKMRNAKVLVVDHPGTTLLLSIGRNIPTIAFWDDNDWKFTEEFSCALRPLRDIGLLHASPESAARFLNVHYSNINEWWFSPEVQEARLLWTQFYAYRDERYLSQWSEYISKKNKL